MTKLTLKLKNVAKYFAYLINLMRLTFFKERCLTSGNGTGPLDNMRNLEHYLNDIMRSGTDNPEHVKGKSLLCVI